MQKNLRILELYPAGRLPGKQQSAKCSTRAFFIAIFFMIFFIAFCPAKVKLRDP
jgi:hypothetical protein